MVRVSETHTWEVGIQEMSAISAQTPGPSAINDWEENSESALQAR
jgi:hypothetical protein